MGIAVRILSMEDGETWSYRIGVNGRLVPRLGDFPTKSLPSLLHAGGSRNTSLTEARDLSSNGAV